MAEFKVKACRPITTEIQVPGDKSISHRAIMFSALANGPCEVSGFLPSEDCLATADAFRAMGIEIEELERGPYGPTRLRVHGRGGELDSPKGDLDCGNSGTTVRLLSGILAGRQPGFQARLAGDESLSRRPMQRVIEPLASMGARIRAEGEGETCPLVIDGAAPLKAIDYRSPVASAQVKSAILLAGLSAEGKTTVSEPAQSRDHTERMLRHFQAKTVKRDQEVSIWGGQTLESRDFHVPGDISSAAFWIVAASAMRDAHLIVRDVGLNGTRTGILKVLIRMGAQITEVVDEPADGEPIGRVEVHGGPLRGTTIEGEDIPNVIDELPALAVAGALAEGKTVIRDAKELRVKESDRILSVVNNLRLMGVEVQERFDGMEIEGGGKLQGAKLDTFGDHRIGMAFAIAGLFADGETVIENTDCIATSYPGFYDQLKLLMSAKGTPAYTPVISSLNPARGREAT